MLLQAIYILCNSRDDFGFDYYDISDLLSVFTKPSYHLIAGRDQVLRGSSELARGE